MATMQCNIALHLKSIAIYNRYVFVVVEIISLLLLLQYFLCFQRRLASQGSHSSMERDWWLVPGIPPGFRLPGRLPQPGTDG